MNRKLLLVQAEELGLSSLVRFLEFCGFEVVTACSTAHALAQLASHGPTFGLAFVDLPLPGADVEQFVAALHRGQPDLTCLLHGEHEDPASRSRLDADASCVLIEKPSSYGNILRAIQQYTASQPRQR